ncbi:MAG TPA: hypothetical protein VHA13_02345 [Gammaproteobacteria bacterium]|nr:hypothetical protein [Gammaproteobacteria bacterium]
MTPPKPLSMEEQRKVFWEEAKANSFETFCEVIKLNQTNNIAAIGDQLFDDYKKMSVEQKAQKIEAMKKINLSELELGKLNSTELELQGGGYSVKVSSRRSSVGEARGAFLLAQLAQMKAKGLKMSLYDAIEIIAKGPEAAKAYLLSFISSVSIQLTLDNGLEVDAKNVILEDAQALNAVISQFIFDIEARGVSEKKWIEALKRIWPEFIDVIKQSQHYEKEAKEWKAELQSKLSIKLLETEIKLAAQDLSEGLAGLENPLLNAKVNELLRKIEEVGKWYPQDRVHLIEILYATKALIQSEAIGSGSSAKNDAITKYAQLAAKISQQAHWGKAIASAMLAIIGTCLVGLCIASGVGAIALPVLAWGMSYVVGAGALGSLASIVGFSLFAREAKRNQAMREVAERSAAIRDEAKNLRCHGN